MLSDINGNGLSVAIKQVLSTFHWNYLEEQIEYLVIDFIGSRFTETTHRTQPGKGLRGYSLAPAPG
ncbi:hypothetical protein CMK12_15090 [Candidatus Poribacteria bacterium]|nr:hypothetical protein [Candidatus Poribacteria bacterium]